MEYRTGEASAKRILAFHSAKTIPVSSHSDAPWSYIGQLVAVCVHLICKPTVTISALSFWGCQYLCSPRLVTTQLPCNSDFHGCSSFFFRCWVDPKRTQTFGFLRENIQHQIGYEVRITRHQTFNPAQVKSSSRQSQFAEYGLLFYKFIPTRAWS